MVKPNSSLPSVSVSAPEPEPDPSTPDRILDAAHRVFLRRGTAGARTQEIAAEAGMDAAVVRRLIGSQADCETVAAMGNEARMMGITGVPSVVIGGAHVVVGAQPADVWLRIIDDIAAHPDRWT